MNYSSYGTYVNNILYANNLIIERTQKVPDNRSLELHTHVRDIVDKRRNIDRETKNSVDNKMIAVDYTNRMECSCEGINYEAIKNGWEGPIVLTHGTLLRFGCVSFVFSIVDCATV